MKMLFKLSVLTSCKLENWQKNFSPEFLKQYNGVPWQQIKGMRDKVAHGYGTIDMDRVWFTALEDINPLLSYCQQILADNK